MIGVVCFFVAVAAFFGAFNAYYDAYQTRHAKKILIEEAEKIAFSKSARKPPL